MGQGPNYVLNKGYVAGGSTAFKLGEVVTLDGDQLVNRAVTADDTPVIGICTEDVDATKVATGKVVVGVAVHGICKAIAGAAITRGAKLTNDTSARVVTQAGAAGSAVHAVALESASAAGELIDVLLTPFNTK
jgi:hypothetical protein